jgi:8-oxo-dGTP pyrophosphatase MutT (NUDIX family)
MEENLADVDVRCSVVLFRDSGVLLVHRVHDGADDWVLPGGTPRPGESMAACARRETAEETGLSVVTGRVAFVAESLTPGAPRRRVDLVFLASIGARSKPRSGEPDMEARFVPLAELPVAKLRPPMAGHLRALYSRGVAGTAPYLGNLWRPAPAPVSAEPA